MSSKLFYRKRNKFRNIPTKYAGFSFSSKLEASVYALLKADENLTNIHTQDSVYLTKARIHYICDFSAFDKKANEKIYIEAKGVETPVWRIKLKLYRVYGPGKLLIYKGTAARPFLAETVISSLGMCD